MKAKKADSASLAKDDATQTNEAKQPLAPTSFDNNLSDQNLSEKNLHDVQLPKIISFDTLARCGDEIWIENSGQIYRLRKTRQGKLILTK